MSEKNIYTSSLTVPKALFQKAADASYTGNLVYVLAMDGFCSAETTFPDGAVFRLNTAPMPVKVDELCQYDMSYSITKDGATLHENKIRDIYPYTHVIETEHACYSVQFNLLDAQALMGQEICVRGELRHGEGEHALCLPYIGLLADYHAQHRFDFPPFDMVFSNVHTVSFLDGTTYIFDCAADYMLERMASLLHNEKAQEIAERLERGGLCWKYLDRDAYTLMEKFYHHPTPRRTSDIGILRITPRLMFSVSFMNTNGPLFLEIELTLSDRNHPQVFPPCFLSLAAVCETGRGYEGMQEQLLWAFASAIASNCLEHELDEPFLTSKEI